MWYQRLHNFLTTIGFKKSYADPSLFLWVQDDETVFLFAYVDDIVITGSSKKKIEEVIEKLGNKFALRDWESYRSFSAFRYVRRTRIYSYLNNNT